MNCQSTPPRPPRGATGFTLVEVQVALVLLALISVVMVGVLRTASQTWTRVSNHQDTVERRLLVNQFLRRQLTNVRFERIRGIDDRRASSFLGSAEALHYVAPFPSFVNNGELYWWTLTSQVDTESEAQRLVLFYQPFTRTDRVDLDEDGRLLLSPSEETQDEEEENVTTEPIEIVLAENMKIESMGFYARTQFDEEIEREEWDLTEIKPRIIRLTLVEIDNEGNETALPELAMTPRFANESPNGSDDAS